MSVVGPVVESGSLVFSHLSEQVSDTGWVNLCWDLGALQHFELDIQMLVESFSESQHHKV